MIHHIFSILLMYSNQNKKTTVPYSLVGFISIQANCVIFGNLWHASLKCANTLIRIYPHLELLKWLYLHTFRMWQVLHHQVCVSPDQNLSTPTSIYNSVVTLSAFLFYGCTNLEFHLDATAAQHFILLKTGWCWFSTPGSYGWWCKPKSVSISLGLVALWLSFLIYHAREVYWKLFVGSTL